MDNTYYYQDELGSTSHIATSGGALIESYQYGVYGKPQVYSPGGVLQPNATPVAKDLGNGGSRWMPELGLYDDRNRFMSPDIGRFLQPDPIGFKGDASNLYRYCGNDWANRTDPMGLMTNNDPADKMMDHLQDLLKAKSWLWKGPNPGSTIFGRSALESLGQSLGLRGNQNLVGASVANHATAFTGQSLSAGQMQTVRNPHDKAHAQVKFGETDPVYETSEAIQAHHPGAYSYTRRNIGEPTGVDDGKVSISQTVTVTRHMPFGAGPGTRLWNSETKRVDWYHGVTNDANAAAQDVAARGFRNVQDGIQQIRESTQRVFNQAEKQGIPEFDLIKSHDRDD